MNRAVICLGSNVAESEEALLSTAESLRGMSEDCVVSGLYTGPSYNGIGADYTNIVMAATTRLSLEQLTEITRSLEKLRGRTPESKQSGVMPLDADIIEWNGRTEKPSDIALPHFTHGFEQIREKATEIFSSTEAI